jgi:hypothetical protein
VLLVRRTSDGDIAEPIVLSQSRPREPVIWLIRLLAYLLAHGLLKGRLQLSDAERATLGEIGHRLGRQVLGEMANVALPETILAWYPR